MMQDFAEHVKRLMDMSEWLRANGERELAEQCRQTANRILDHIAYAQYANRQQGACKGKSPATGSGNASRGEEP